MTDVFYVQRVTPSGKLLDQYWGHYGDDDEEWGTPTMSTGKLSEFKTRHAAQEVADAEGGQVVEPDEEMK